MKTRTLLLGALVCSLLQACAAPQTRQLRATPLLEAAPVQIPDVPFFPQEDHQCGPAALATMLTFAGKKTAPDALTEKVYVPARKGSFALEMVAAARAEGRLVYPLAPQLESVLTALAQGYPV